MPGTGGQSAQTHSQHRVSGLVAVPDPGAKAPPYVPIVDYERSLMPPPLLIVVLISINYFVLITARQELIVALIERLI